MKSDSIPFAGKTVIVSGDLNQLPPVLPKKFIACIC